MDWTDRSPGPTQHGDRAEDLAGGLHPGGRFEEFPEIEPYRPYHVVYEDFTAAFGCKYPCGGMPSRVAIGVASKQNEFRSRRTGCMMNRKSLEGLVGLATWAVLLAGNSFAGENKKKDPAEIAMSAKV